MFGRAPTIRCNFHLYYFETKIYDAEYSADPIIASTTPNSQI